MAEVCPVCKGTGFELKKGEGGVTTSLRCACELRDRGDGLRRAARIPRRYEHCTIESFEVQDPTHDAALQAATEWVELWPTRQPGLLFLGQPGTGKTHIAVAIAQALIATKNARVLFYEQRELLKALQGTFDAGAHQRETEVLGPVLDAEVLILDDLGAGRTTPWARDVMHDVIAHRYNHEKPLIMTSNLATGDEAPRRGTKRPVDEPLSLKERLGDPLMSRLYEMCRILRLQGRDYRIGVKNAEIQR